jgi:hypothetical protein
VGRAERLFVVARSALRREGLMASSSIFFGFSSELSNLADVIRNAANRIAETPSLNVISWENLRVGGKLLLEPIEAAIRNCDVAVFDLTQLNENVLFELGLAIGADRVVWP